MLNQPDPVVLGGFDLSEQVDFEPDFEDNLDDLQNDPGSLADMEEDTLDEQLLEVPPSADNISEITPMSTSESTQTTEDIVHSSVHVANLKNTLKFIDSIRNATLDNGNYPPGIIERLRNPPKCPIDLDEYPDLCLSLELFLSTSRASEETYHNTRAAFLRRHPEDNVLSLNEVKRKVEQITGVVSIVDDMCKNSCLAYTGPFSDCDQCPTCGEPRYDPILLQESGGKKRVAQQQFHTILLGPQLQALWASPQCASAMRYRRKHTSRTLHEHRDAEEVLHIPVYDDVFSGSDYLTAVENGEILEEDMTLVYSIDGAQLYAYKTSDCWIYIWIVLDLPPELRYKKKHVLPGGFIPGPNKPKDTDSFIYRGFHHLSAIQKEGLVIWDALEDRTFKSRPYLMLGTADGPGMALLAGLVGHQGAEGCRTTCDMHGRHKAGQNTYYPVHLKPQNFTVPGSDHGDVDIIGLATQQRSPEAYQQKLRYLLLSPNNTQYQRRRMKTGIVKPTLLSAVPRSLGVPRLIALDLMHLGMNTTTLLLDLWRGRLDCDATDSRDTWDWAVLRDHTWVLHGQAVAQTTPYLPGSFDRPPRNPAEKLSSGYKAWELLMYVFGLGPALFYRLLPWKYWQHFCKLALAFRLLYQRSISRQQLVLVNSLLQEYVIDFEKLYYQRRADRIHFCRPCIHLLIHLASEAIRIGPLPSYAQWTLERTIGNLGEEIKQPSKPYANLSHRGLLRSQVNALLAIYPCLDTGDAKGSQLPRGAIDLGNGTVLLRAKDRTARKLSGPFESAIQSFLEAQCGPKCNIPPITRWARLRLANGQIARSAWKEKCKPLEKLRTSRNVKVNIF